MQNVVVPMLADPASEYAIMVLLVDDQLLIGEAIRRMIASQPNIDFHYCSTAQDALAVAKEIKPTVILQDLVMPGVDGLELVRQYRADPATSATPIIVLSATEDASVKREAFRLGVNDYLVKLPDELELIARIQYHSKAYLNQLQRDDAYRALRESQHQLMEMNFELQRLMSLDGLTCLSNRRYFDQQIAAEWTRAFQGQKKISLLMVDVDHFKDFNDTSGHLTGDTILKKVADTIQKIFPSVSCTARFGGDEFAIVLGAISTIDCKVAAEDLRREIENLRLLRENDNVGSPYLTVSVGVASMVPQAEESFYTLITAADQALYEAKKAGRNRVVTRES
jgi:two-component system chemotaxis family response regulator WspR